MNYINRVIVEGLKYHDDNARIIGTRILKIFSPYISSLGDYRFDDTESNVFIFKFYLSLIKHEVKYRNNLLPKILRFAEQYNSNIRVYIDNNKICIEMTVPKNKI